MSATATRPSPTAGLYETDFWSFVDNGEVRMQRSRSTGRLRYPPSPVCPDTLDPEFDWVPIEGSARLLAWTVFRRTYFPTIPAPYTVVVVEISEGPIMVGHLDGDQSATLRHDLAMELAFDTVETETGPRQLFTWLPTSRPTQSPTHATRNTHD
jgi:uncharacterized OB-fold protein